MMKRNALGYLLILLCLSLGISSCEKKIHLKDLRHFVESLRQSVNLAGTTENNTMPLDPPAVTYQANQLREPFLGTGSEKSETRVAGKSIQSYPLNTIRFVGTVTKGKNYVAYIVTPDNLIYQVKEGDIIGDQHGKVVKIESSKMKIVEEDMANGEKSMQRMVTLQLASEPQKD